MRPWGAFSTSPALTGQTSYISPEPKRCVERKVLNCLPRIIPNPRLAVGENPKNLAAPTRDSASPSAESAVLASTHTAAARQNLTRVFSQKLHRMLKAGSHVKRQILHRTNQSCVCSVEKKRFRKVIRKFSLKFSKGGVPYSLATLHFYGTHIMQSCEL